MQKERQEVVPILLMVTARSGSQYLKAFDVDGSAVKKVVLKEVVMDNLNSVLVWEDRKQEMVLKMCTHRWLRDRLKQWL